MPEPRCCGGPMYPVDGELAIYGCVMRDHHPRYIHPALVELLGEAYTAGATGQPLREFLADRDLHTRLDKDGYIDQA